MREISSEPSWRQALRAGSAASLLSMAALLLRGRSEGLPVLRGLNAVSHWLWDEKAFAQDKPSWRYTVPATIIHHMSSLFWASLLTLGTRKARLTKMQLAQCAAATTALAWVVDFNLTPRRLTPGFERVVSRKSRVLVYTAFAAGLALGAINNTHNAIDNTRKHR